VTAAGPPVAVGWQPEPSGLDPVPASTALSPWPVVPKGGDLTGPPTATAETEPGPTAETAGCGDSETASSLLTRTLPLSVTPDVRRTDPEGIDYGWVMQTTFVLTIVVGVPVVAVLSVVADLPTWSDRAVFAVRVGAPVWLFTAVSVYAYARHQREDEEVE